MEKIYKNNVEVKSLDIKEYIFWFYFYKVFKQVKLIYVVGNTDLVYIWWGVGIKKRVFGMLMVV